MFASLRGRLLSKNLKSVVIECGGVGYDVSMSIPALGKLPGVGTEAFVLIHTLVSQEAIKLYGFVEENERTAFTILLSASGVGPRLALAILSSLTPQELSETMLEADKHTLVRIPGIGHKKAERLLVELKDKFTTLLQEIHLKRDLETSSTSTSSNLESQSSMIKPQTPSLLLDLNSALLNLGFNELIAKKAAHEAILSCPDETDLTKLLRTALRNTTPRPS